ncbi:hypothetical protein EW026_g947 [Hermanssonia centrifuga]|uniref:Uncharacterized protein n=1 Tax=Hermanssonia centrifuga TaxID=98765 RepID=A0A4S4KT35_9APHY|nr:hypothetical protein EW026_g947 [Hermanssonia centrifuga]
MSSTPIYHSTTQGYFARPRISVATEFGNATDFWVEYPSGLVDVTRTAHLSNLVKADGEEVLIHKDAAVRPPPLNAEMQWELEVDADRTLRLAKTRSAFVIVDMQKNWGLTDHELTTIPPSLVRGFMKSGRGGFGSELPSSFGRLLMRDQYNSELYGPLQILYEEGKAAGTDVWIHKNRMSGLWGPQSALDLYLQAEGITSLMFAGVNADQWRP